MLTSPRNYMVSNVELNWARLDQPVSPFGAAQWELQIATTDKAVADDLKANPQTCLLYTSPSPRDS